jgi:hypothetical protein
MRSHLFALAAKSTLAGPVALSGHLRAGEMRIDGTEVATPISVRSPEEQAILRAACVS